MLGIFDDSQIEIIKIHKALSLRKKKHKGKKGNKGKTMVSPNRSSRSVMKAPKRVGIFSLLNANSS